MRDSHTVSPIEQLANLVVGVVESVTSNEIRVLLELDAPHSTALNTGTPTAFPRLNGYVLIPNEAGATVGYVSWLGIERSPYPKRAGFKDFGVIDLPFPLRKMSVCPVGTLTSRRDRSSGGVRFELSRGVAAFPSVGDQVLVPTPDQVAAIVGAGEEDRRVKIGVSPMAANADIKVDPDKLFGRHLAVLGNTGSGKSCTVAGLIRWSLEAAREKVDGAERPNARFIILDPNGEYAKAFQDEREHLRVFQVAPRQPSAQPLQVPAWLWNGHEWATVAQAQPGAQRPLLFQGIRELKAGETTDDARDGIIRRYLLSCDVRVASFLEAGAHAFQGSPRSRFEFARFLESLARDAAAWSSEVAALHSNRVMAVSARAHEIWEARRSGEWFRDFDFEDLESLRRTIRTATDALPDTAPATPIGEDTPRRFDPGRLVEHLERIASGSGGSLLSFISTLGLRIKAMLSDDRLGPVIAHENTIALDEWLEAYIGDDGRSLGPVSIIDLSLVPAEVIHVIIAVLARVVFEGLQRYRRANPLGLPLPTVLVLEEAHTFVRRSRDGDGDGPLTSPARLCRETFERIAREGRKFGLGLVLSSQRPSELSQTALAQCNTFLLHRIVNDADQQLVAKLVPDNVGGLLKELPSLPSRQAILLGWATPLPVLVEIDELAPQHCPQSDDPDFWAVWTRRRERAVDWGPIAREWAGEGPEPSS